MRLIIEPASKVRKRAPPQLKPRPWTGWCGKITAFPTWDSLRSSSETRIANASCGGWIALTTATKTRSHLFYSIFIKSLEHSAHFR